MVSFAPINERMDSPNNNPKVVNIILITAAIRIACSAQLSALTLSSEPINRAMEAVTPVPNPNVNPITKKKRGILYATAAIDSPPKKIEDIIKAR